MFGVAIYGDALKMVSDLLIHIASFNQLSLEIGRMEWTNLFVILAMSVFLYLFVRRCKQRFPSCVRLGSTVQNRMPRSDTLHYDICIVHPNGDGLCRGHFRLRLIDNIGCHTAFILIFALVQKRKMRGIYHCADSEYMPKKSKTIASEQ